MKKSLSYLMTLACLVTSTYAVTPMTDQEVKNAIIQESIANYSGNCPCPYSSMRNGNQCGSRSAYSKPGGASPVCYQNNVTQGMIRTYRRMHGG